MVCVSKFHEAISEASRSKLNFKGSPLISKNKYIYIVDTHRLLTINAEHEA